MALGLIRIDWKIINSRLEELMLHILYMARLQQVSTLFVGGRCHSAYAGVKDTSIPAIFVHAYCSFATPLCIYADIE